MDTVSLVAKPDHILRLAGLSDPVRALIELIWNGLDAEATRVDVDLSTDDLGGISTVTVRDNGHGMNRQECVRDFQLLGGSWKSGAMVSPTIKRPLHGRTGRGRLRAFAIGNHVEWRTIAEGVESHRAEVIVRGTASQPTEFSVSDSVRCADTEKTGTVFRSWDPAKYVNRLDRDDVGTRLAAAFALFLQGNPDTSITFRGVPLKPESAWNNSTEIDIKLAQSSDNVGPHLRIIEWRDEVPRSLYLCDGSGNVLAATPVGIQTPGYSFTAYLLWDEFKQHLDTIALADLGEEIVAEAIASARQSIREHFRDRELPRRKRLVAEWKEESVYPYIDEPVDATQLAERGLFDEVATTLARKLPKGADGKRTTLRLLREIVSSDPERIIPVVNEFFRLPRKEQEQLRELLEDTTLSSIVRATHDVSDRFKLLAGLKDMVFDTRIRRHVKERSQLHKILERETWVFGDEYSLMASDRDLDTVLDRHLQTLGKKVESTRSTPVRRESGQRGIVDLVLGRARRPSSRREHLVVELKAPRVKVGPREVAQIQEYAEAVTSDPQFRSTGVQWNFWVVSTELSQVVENSAKSPVSPQGCIDVWPNGVYIWAKSWSEVINECESRLSYYRDCLKYEASQAGELRYFRQLHGDVAPPSLLSKGELP